jgi:hypothetical protein
VVVIGIAAGQPEPVGVWGEDADFLSLEVPNLPVLPFADWLRLESGVCIGDDSVRRVLRLDQCLRPQAW